MLLPHSQLLRQGLRVIYCNICKTEKGTAFNYTSPSVALGETKESVKVLRLRRKGENGVALDNIHYRDDCMITNTKILYSVFQKGKKNSNNYLLILK